MKKTNLIDYKYDELLILAEEIKRMLIASLNTAKENKKVIDNVRKNTEVDKTND